MINRRENYVLWALLLHELEDAREHLDDLIREVSNGGEMEEVDFRVDLGHVYAHLNRAWNGRNENSESGDERWRAQSRFPEDLEPT